MPRPRGPLLGAVTRAADQAVGRIDVAAAGQGHEMVERFPTLRSVVLDAVDARELAEFYCALLGYEYRPGDEPPPEGEPDVKATEWLVLIDPSGRERLAVQPVDHLPEATWPDGAIPQQLHLDLTVHTTDELAHQRTRASSLGARELLDRFDDDDEPLYVFADPAGHPFCIFVSDPTQP